MSKRDAKRVAELSERVSGMESQEQIISQRLDAQWDAIEKLRLKLRKLDPNTPKDEIVDAKQLTCGHCLRGPRAHQGPHTMHATVIVNGLMCRTVVMWHNLPERVRLAERLIDAL